LWKPGRFYIWIFWYPWRKSRIPRLILPPGPVPSFRPGRDPLQEDTQPVSNEQIDQGSTAVGLFMEVDFTILCRDTGCAGWTFSWFSSSPQADEKFRKKAM
jgi:hypothetical protein